MRIVHFDEVFHPEFGYQINILPKYQVKQGHEVIIVTGESKIISHAFSTFGDNNDMDKKDKAYEDNTGIKIIRIPVIRYISRRALFKKGYGKIVDDLKPDILFCHFNDSIVGMYYTWKYKRTKYPIVFDSHMLEMASQNRFNYVFRAVYRRIFAPIIIKYNIKVIRTQNDNFVEKCLGIPLKQCPWISVGSDTVLFNPNGKIKKEFRKEHNIDENDFVIVYTGKLDQAKGGRLLAETFKKRLIAKNGEPVVVLVVGNSSGEYGKEIEKIFNESENRIIRFPTQKYSDLAQFYQSSDLSVFPKQCSLSFYDAQACALPVVSEDNNINVDRLQSGNGFNFNSGSIDDFREKIKLCINMNKDEYAQMKNNSYKYIKADYDYEEISKQYTDILIEEVKNFNKRGK